MKINIMTEDMAEFTGQIIDIFDDFLEERGVRIPSSDEEMEENGELEGNDARIYGTDYGFLQEKLEELLDGWAEKNGEHPVKAIDSSDVKGITLLSIEEYEEHRDAIPPVDRWWWLRSPGCIKSFTAYAGYNGCIYGHGIDVTMSGGSVRPALRLDPESVAPQLREKLRFGGRTWTYIGGGLAIADEPFCQMAFRKNWDAVNANDYEASDVKAYLDAWLEGWCQCGRLTEEKGK